MMKAIKGVSEDVWQEFKAIAVRQNTTMGKLFENMVSDYKRISRKFWNDILTGEKILSDREAEEMIVEIAKSRKEYGFRE